MCCPCRGRESRPPREHGGDLGRTNNSYAADKQGPPPITEPGKGEASTSGGYAGGDVYRDPLILVHMAESRVNFNSIKGEFSRYLENFLRTDGRIKISRLGMERKPWTIPLILLSSGRHVSFVNIRTYQALLEYGPRAVVLLP